MNRRIIFLLALSLFGLNTALFAQAIICPSVNAQIGTGPSTTICQGNCAVLTASVLPIKETTTYSVGSIPFAPQPTVGATTIVLSDDSQGGPYPIGFNFCFFGNTYNQFYIGSNGWVGFTAGQTNAFTSAAIPSAAFNVPRNCIMGPWQDWHPGIGIGPYISYRTIGVAPCRALVVTWYNIPMFSCTTTFGNFQIICYETTNIIENHLTNKPNCLAWAGGTSVQGIHNLPGTIGIAVPGRNSTAWTAVNEGWRYTPNGIPTFTISWVGPSGPIATGSQVTVCPPATAVYTANATLGGCIGSTSLGGTVQVVVQPSPTITANSATVCAGTGTTLVAGGATSYTWQPGNIFGPTASFTPAATSVYTVYGTSAIGCLGFQTVTITVSPQPTATPGSNSPICVGGTLNLTSNAAASYTWTGPNAFTSNLQNPSISPVTAAAAGNYTVKITAPGGCTTQAVINVVINPLPIITVNSPSVCPGMGATLNAGGASTYTWLPPNVVGSSVTFTPAITTVYTVNATSALGCTSSATSTITINPSPVPLPGSNSPVCTGANINLTVNAATSYTWSGPNAFSSNLQNPTIANATTVHAGSYTVKVTSALGCTAQAVVVVVVNLTPTITVGNTGPYCPGATIQLTVTAANSYTWTGPSSFNSNLQNPTIANSTTLMTGPYVVTVTAVGGCISTGTTNVVVNPAPQPTATSNSPICLNKQINLFVNPAASSYTWSGPNAFASNAQNPTIATASLVNAGNYTVTVTNAAGCTSSAVVNVVINPLPVVMVNSPTICVGSTFTLTAITGTAFAWTGPNAYSSALQNPPFASAQSSLSGNYTVLVTSAQGCTNTGVASVLVVGLPTVTIAGNNTLCSQNFNGSPNTTTLTASGASTFTWTLPAGFSGNPNLNTTPLVVTPPVTSTSLVATMTVVGSAGSCTSQAVIQVTVYPNPTITATSGSMCAGTQVTLTASNATTYTWTPSATLNTPNGPSVIANPTVTTVYTIIGSSVGCNSQSQNATASVVPNPTVTVLPNPAVICLNQAINLTASGATNYTWTPNIALTTTNVANTTANPTVTTTYSVIGEALTCTHVANITVSVLPLPTITIVPSSPTLCMNNFNGSPNTVSLTANGAASYTWGPIMGLTTNTLNGSMIIGTSNGAAIVTGTVIGANGTCTNIGTFTLNAIPNPTISTTSGSMCVGTSVNLTASNATTYTWTPSATLNTPNGPSVIASPAVTTVYSIIGGSVGCNSQTQNATASVVANPTVSIAPTTPTICFGNSINLTANGANNYTWSPNIAITSTVGNVVTVNPTVTTVYTIIGEAATCTNTAAQTVTVVPLPIITIALNSPTMCMNNYNGSVNQITVTASGGTSYNWTGFNGVAASSNVGSPIVVTAILNIPLGTGTVIGAVGNCTNGATFSVIAAPNPIISVPSVSVCQGKSVMLTASGAQTYQWSPPTNLNSVVGTTVMANPNNTAVYSVIGSSINCQGPTETTTVTVVANPVIVIAPVTPTICAGSAIGLTAFGANNYTWSPAVNINTLNGNFVIVTPTVTMNYIVVGEAATCTSVAVREVSVIPLPDLQAISDKTVICIGDKVTINANGALNYTWTPTFGLSSGTSNFVVASPTVSTLYTLIGTNGVCTKTITYGITVMTRPILNLMTTNKKICKGGSAMIIVSGCQGYLWHPTSDSTILASNTTTNTTSMVVTPTANMNYTITGFNSSGASACPFSKEILVEVVPTITPGVSFSATICEGNSTKLQAEGSNTYQWTPFDGLSNPNISQPYANPKSTTIYTVRVSDGGFCGETATVLVKVTPQPTVDAGPDMILNSDEPMFLNAKGTGTLTWVFGDNIICHVCPNSQVTATRSGVYHVQTTNEFGCTAIDDVWIEITNDYPIFVPNSFTPNYDGLNDVFLVYGEGIIKFEMSIYNRWNQKIFNSNDQKAGWDGEFKGELVKNDSYLYIINYTTYDNKKRQKIGYVVILKEDY